MSSGLSWSQAATLKKPPTLIMGIVLKRRISCKVMSNAQSLLKSLAPLVITCDIRNGNFTKSWRFLFVYSVSNTQQQSVSQRGGRYKRVHGGKSTTRERSNSGIRRYFGISDLVDDY
jgi:hypothetical protein